MSYRRGRRRNHRPYYNPFYPLDEVLDALEDYEQATGETLDLDDFGSPEEALVAIRALLDDLALDDDDTLYDPFDYTSFDSPRSVFGGIRAQPLSGAIGRKWWSKRWSDALEPLSLPNRLEQGRWCARNGQVLQLDIGSGGVRARVQGARQTSYEVSIALAPYGRNKWKALAEKLTQQPLLLAQMLAGQFPRDMEALCVELDIALFPRDHLDLALDCGCADRVIPCKHITAVYYVLAEVFDGDPFFLFHLRGMSREGLLALMGLAPPPPPVGDAKVLDISPIPRDAEPSSGSKSASEGARVFEIAPPVAPRRSPAPADSPPKSVWPEPAPPAIPAATDAADGPEAPPGPSPDPAAEGASLCADLERFWRQQGDPKSFPAIRPPDTYPAISATLPKQLGTIPCWQSPSSLPRFLSRHYGKASMMLYEARQSKR